MQSPTRPHSRSLDGVGSTATNWPRLQVTHAAHDPSRWPSSRWNDPAAQVVQLRAWRAESAEMNVALGHTVCAVQRSAGLAASGWYVSAVHGTHDVSSLSFTPGKPGRKANPAPHVLRFAAHDVGVSLNEPSAQREHAASSRVFSAPSPATNLLSLGHALACFLGVQLVALFLYCPPAHSAHVKPSLVPAHVPRRALPSGHAMLSHALQANLFSVPAHEPLRNWPFGHSRFEHVMHTPFLIPLEPARYSSLEHVGCAAHVPFLVVLKSERY